jgi:hypothetical protein
VKGIHTQGERGDGERKRRKERARGKGKRGTERMRKKGGKREKRGEVWWKKRRKVQIEV